MSGAGAFLNGLASGYYGGEEIKRHRTIMNVSEPNKQRSIIPDPQSQTAHPVNASNKLVTEDPANDALPAHARAFLNAAALGESSGAYNVRYTPNGAATFDLSTNSHPRITEQGPNGPSTAAGRYGFTATTWDEMGMPDFSPRNQDAAAWDLAKARYKAYTGNDLEQALLANGGPSADVFTALAPTWESFHTNPSRFVDAYNSSYGRYSVPVTTPRSVKTTNANSILGKINPS